MEISVTRGLVQLKRLEQRINKKISLLETYVVSNKKSSKNVCNGLYTRDEFENKAKSEWASLNDLINLRKEIKDAIVKSNANTIVNICGIEYTIAQAIERKKSIEEFENTMLYRIKKAFNQTTKTVELANERVEADAQTLFGKPSDENKKSEINRIELMNLYIDTNEHHVVDPLNFKDVQHTLEQNIEDFLSEVDQVLSESNAVTMISITKNPMDIK